MWLKKLLGLKKIEDIEKIEEYELDILRQDFSDMAKELMEISNIFSILKKNRLGKQSLKKNLIERLRSLDEKLKYALDLDKKLEEAEREIEGMEEFEEKKLRFDSNNVTLNFRQLLKNFRAKYIFIGGEHPNNDVVITKLPEKPVLKLIIRDVYDLVILTEGRWGWPIYTEHLDYNKRKYWRKITFNDRLKVEDLPIKIRIGKGNKIVSINLEY